MSERFVPPPPEVVAELRRVAEQPLSPEKFDAWVNSPMSDFDREEMDSLIDWFMRRFPTPAERLRYSFHMRRSWALLMPPDH